MTVETRIVKPTSIVQGRLRGSTVVFLAGSIDNGAAVEWQARVEERIARETQVSVTIYNPRRDDWNASLKQDISDPDFSYQVNWELDNLDDCHIAMFYFSPDGPAPITLMELGYLLGGRHGTRIIVACPEGYWRRGNVQIMCQRAGIPIFDTLDEAVSRVVKELVPRHPTLS